MKNTTNAAALHVGESTVIGWSEGADPNEGPREIDGRVFTWHSRRMQKRVRARGFATRAVWWTHETVITRVA